MERKFEEVRHDDVCAVHGFVVPAGRVFRPVWRAARGVFRLRIPHRAVGAAFSSVRRRSRTWSGSGRLRPARRRDGGERAEVRRGVRLPRVSVRGGHGPRGARAERLRGSRARGPSGGRRQGEGFGDDGVGGAQHRGEQGARVETALAGGAHDAGQDLLGVGPAPGAVAAADLAYGHRGPDGLFGPPVGGVDGRVE